MKKKKLIKLLNQAQARYKAYRAANKCDAKQDVLDYLAKDIELYEKLIDDKIRETVLNTPLPKLWTLNYKEKEALIKIIKDVADKFEQLNLKDADDANKYCESAYVDKEEKEIPTDPKLRHWPTKERVKEEKTFDYELNKKFALFNGWRIENASYGGVYYTRECRSVNIVSAKEELNYLENPELIQETKKNLEADGFLTGFNGTQKELKEAFEASRQNENGKPYWGCQLKYSSFDDYKNSQNSNKSE